MDKSMYSKLEGIMDEFNNSIKRNIQNGKPKQELDDSIKALLDDCQKRFEAVFQNSEFRRPIANYIADRFTQLRRSLSTSSRDLSFDTSDFLCRLNETEFNQNIDILSQSRLSNEAQSEELEQTSAQKLRKLEAQKPDIKRQANKDSENLRTELNKIYKDTCEYGKTIVRRSTSGRQFMLAVSSIEAAELFIPEVSNKINPIVAERYKEALTKYAYTSYDAFMAANPGYKKQIFEAAGLELDLSKQSTPVVIDPFKETADMPLKDSARTSGVLRNPFEEGITDEMKRKVEEVSRNATPPPKTKIERSSLYLDSDIII